MGDKSKIEWTEATWNPVTGCDRVSEGCDHCYALTLAGRLKAMGNRRYQRDGDPRTSGPGFGVTLHEDQLDLPLRWKRPRMVFANSMSDLFHDAVPDEFIAQVFAVMGLAWWHTFQVLTKRPGRMASWLRGYAAGGRHIWEAAQRMPMPRGMDKPSPGWPFPNVWLGTSVETQKWADVRIPKLLETPAAVRFLSCEPLLGPVNLTSLLSGRLDALAGDAKTASGEIYAGGRGIEWVIVGGESGKGARPMNLMQARSLVEQCRSAGVPVFVKQLGRRPVEEYLDYDAPLRLKDPKGGDPEEWPEDLRVRETLPDYSPPS